MKKAFWIALALLLATPATAQTCWTEAMVTTQETADGSVAVPLNVIETASLIEGLRKKYPDGTWIRDVDNSISYTLVARSIVRIVYFKDGCAATMTDLPLDVFLEIISQTSTLKKTGFEI